MKLTLLALVLSLASTLAAADPAQPKQTAEAPAPPLTLTMEPRYLTDSPNENRVIYAPDSDVRRTSYERYHFSRSAFLHDVGGSLPTQPFQATVHISSTTTETSQGVKGGSQPMGGFAITVHKARLISAEVPPATIPKPTECTQSTGPALAVTFVNSLKHAVEIQWVSPECEIKVIQSLEAGKSAKLDSFNGHVFRFTNPQTNTVQSSYVAQGKQSVEHAIR
ncbi:MAG: hypothetical protein EA397_02310 [Deltaproteobacteria bacterium]|nr:MAG: hypothetical protein EA397_02310 [Deltaproteobacteria bacterium]